MKANKEQKGSFFTQATESLGAVSSGVDTRTGIYSVHLTLAKLTVNNGLGPDFDLILRYSPLSSENYGFGKGFSIGVTAYNRGTKTLKLYTGEQYKILESDGSENKVIILGQKICHFTFTKISNNQYVVSYKDGRKEYLKGAGDSFDIKITHQILSPTRQGILFDWDFSWARGIKLISVYTKQDNLRKLIDIHYIEESKTTLHLYNNTKEAYDVELIFFNNFLTSLKTFVLDNENKESEVLQWEFSYTKGRQDSMFLTWGNWLNKVTYPGGMTEIATYSDSKGHSFPSTANLPDLPYVTVFERFLDSKMSVLATKSEYKYSENNYLGGNTRYNWGNEGVDENGLEYIYTMWKLNPTYTYTCIETKIVDIADNKNRTIVTSIYNIFHLLISQKSEDVTGVTTNSIEHYALNNESPASQSANYKMPRKINQTFENKDGKKVTICTETTYDDFSNLTSKRVTKKADSTLIEPSISIEYYAGAETETKNGIELSCPADPDGYIKFIKCITITPCSTKNNEEVKTLYYSYKDIDSGVILKIKESQINSLNTITTSYFYDSSSENLGRVTGETYVITRGNNVYTSVTTYNYIDGPNSYTRHTTYLSHDNKKISSDVTLSKLTGRIFKEIEFGGKKMEYEYDYLGRVTNKKTSVSHSEKLEDKYFFYLNAEEKHPLKTLHIRPDGVRSLQEFDSFSRILQIRINTDNDGFQSFSKWPVTDKYQYDLLGRKSIATKFDYILDGNSYKKIMEKSVIYRYDIWGNECQRKTSAGLTENITFDPVTMTNTYTFQNAKGNHLLGDITEEINHFGSQLKTTHYCFDKKEAYVSTYVRDGWNRVFKKVNAYGGILLQEFDCYDRTINETRYDNNQLHYEYAAFSTESFLESLELKINTGHTVNGEYIALPIPSRSLIGKKRYDGLGRLIENKAFNRRWSYEYQNDNSTVPCEIIDPSGIVKVVSYTDLNGPKIKEAYIRQGKEKLSISDFNYDKITGSVLEGVTDKCTVTRVYHRDGYIKSESLSYDAGNRKSIEYKWSLGGLLYSITDAQGFTQENTFDEFGRIVLVAGDKVQVAYEYDELSRVTSHTVLKKDDKHCIETTMRYDAFGREIFRKVHDNLHTAKARIIKQSWDKLNRLVIKEFYSIDNKMENKIATEKYTYNSDGSVLSYDCIKVHKDGLSHIPTDKYGNIILNESYEYDAFGNVIKNVRNFMPSEVGKSSLTYSNTAIFTYDATERTRLVEINNTHESYPASLKFEYDSNGNITRFAENQITYDDVGRINRINSSPYLYDALDRLVKTGDTERLYAFRQLRSETRDSMVRTSLFVGHHGAESNNDDIILTACDGKNSCIYAANSTQGEWQAYTLYGERDASKESMSFAGYNGEFSDSTIDAYILGAGYRCYSPSLLRFITPDSPFNSPFGAAGINPYTYCIGDPVNNADPTGQISWQGWVGLGAGGIGLMMTILTGGLAIAAASGILATSLAVGATTASLISGVTAIVGTSISGISPDATRILRWVSLGTGLLSFSSGVGGMAQGLYKAMRELGLRTTIATMGFTSRVGLALNTLSYATATVSYSISLTKRILDQTTLAQSNLNTILGHISFGVGLVSDAASISHFALSKAMPRSFSWDVPQNTTMDEISLRSLTPGGNSLDANSPGSYVHYSEMLIPQINSFFLHIPLQARI